MIENIDLLTIETSTEYPGVIEEYTGILSHFRVQYKAVDYHLQIGQPTATQGWILHMSVIISQITKLFEVILPELIREKVAFKIPKEKEVARLLLDGHLGYYQLGKIITIYPDSELKAIDLAKRLIILSGDFKGPRIPTDAHLGGVVYTRYGAFIPIQLSDSNGIKESFMYGPQGNLIKDTYSVPFSIPSSIKWPFKELAQAKSTVEKTSLNHKFKAISILKSDARGNVIKGLYLKGLFNVKICLIKQGRRYMSSDANGRDIRDRLIWQKELHHALEGKVSLPKIYDLFEMEGDTYLVMEFIKGISLYELKNVISKNCKTWIALSPREQATILHRILSVLSSIQKLHECGYVHRDITPVNFLVQKDKVYLIDIELAYCLKSKSPLPPFSLGTPGFMSPEQFASEVPTIKEDIYGLCASMVQLLTGLSPIKFNTSDLKILASNLDFFIRNNKISNLIAAGLSSDPTTRPEISLLMSTIENYENEIKNSNALAGKIDRTNESVISQIKKVIQDSVNSLAEPPIAMAEGLWLSRSLQEKSAIVNENKEHSLYAGLSIGISGPLYLLSKVRSSGFEINGCIESYYKCWDFLDANYLNDISEVPPGLNSGSSGIALAMAEGIRSGLLENTSERRSLLKCCLERETVGYDIAMGAAGQGVALLQCKDYLSADIFKKQLTIYIQIILEGQQADGSWIRVSTESGKEIKVSGFSYGVSGITWFLLECLSLSPNSEKIKVSVTKALLWLSRKYRHIKDIFSNEVSTETPDKENIVDDEGPAGIILCLIKAYEVLRDVQYKKIAENALSYYPEYIVNNNLTQGGGLAGLGELYLEAYRVFKNVEWERRAAWIANVYIHLCFYDRKNNCFWILNENNRPTGDFMSGISGIIHFLFRSLDVDKVGYRLLK